MRALLLILFALVSFPAFSSYTKIANNGSDLPDSAVLGSGATQWACTRDNQNGLIWEVKTAENGLRDRSKTYTNYDDTNQNQKSTSGGYVKPTQADINAASNSIGFINAVNTVTLCGSAAWRMPSKDELLTLVRPSYSPMIDPAFFPNTPSEYFWSSTPYTDSAFAWVRPFGVGNSVGVDFRSEGSRYRVRLVRTGLPVSNFLLTVSAIGAGSGNITGGGINCASTAGATSGICSNNVVASDSTATLTASPYSGNTFSGWSGCDHLRMRNLCQRCRRNLTTGTIGGEMARLSVTQTVVKRMMRKRVLEELAILRH